MDKQILAIGGSRHFQMLPYYGSEVMLVPLLSEPIKWVTELPPEPMVHTMKTEKYRIEKLADSDTRSMKLIWVHEDLPVEEALQMLQEGLTKMFINQPYKEPE